MSERYITFEERKYTEKKPYMADFHYHNCYEIYYLFSGNIRYLINCNLFDINEGDLVLIKRNELHMTKKLDKDFGENIKIYLEENAFDKSGENAEKFKDCFNYNHVILSAHQKKYVLSIISKIRKEYKSNDPFSKQLTNNYIYELLSFIYKLIFVETEDISDIFEVSNNEINKAIRYIYNNYNKPLTLSGISDYCHMNPSYFSRFFKKSTGLNLIDYINTVRIKNAVFLLTNTTLSIAEIAQTCGYNDQGYFCKTFKKINGCTASEYKKNIIKA